MVFRSLTQDQRTLTLGEAAMLVFGTCSRVAFTSTLLVLKNGKNETFSLEGNEKEVAALADFYAFNNRGGIGLEKLRTIPPEMAELLDGQVNNKTRCQAAILAFRAHGFEPPAEPSQVVRWLKTLK